MSLLQVNTWGNVVYDEYVCPLERVVDFRTEVSGIRPKNLKKGIVFTFSLNHESKFVYNLPVVS